MKTIRWGIIGCGDVTEVKSGPGFQKADGSSLVAVMRRNGELARDYAQRHGVPKWYDNAEALIHDPQVDAVYVATPPYAHKDYTLMSARAGKPVYVEKPMGMNYGECQAMIEACQAAGVPLLVAYYRRSLDRFLKIKQLIVEGAIGEVRTVQIALYKQLPGTEAIKSGWRFRPEIGGGGEFADLSCHTLDFLDYTLGPIEAVQGWAANQGRQYLAEDVVSGSFQFESGVLGAGIWCFTGFQGFDQTEIVGSKGKISFSTFGADPVLLTTAGGVQPFSIHYPAHIQQPLIQQIVNQLNGLGHCPSTGESAARTNWVMDQLLKGYQPPL
jgi:predicted dehydrogenase